MTSRSKLATAAIAPIAFAVASIYLLRSNNWAAWGVEALPAKTPSTVSFGDLANITATADCLRDQLPIDGCDPYGRPFQPYVELPANAINFLGLGTENTEVIGLALAIIFFLTVTLISVVVAIQWKRSLPPLIFTQALLALIAISPASMLAVERGQIEQLTLALVVVAIILLSTHRAPVKYIGSLASVVATVTKYLSIGMFLPFINRSIFTKENWAALLGLILSALFVLWSLPNVLLATETSGASNPQTTKSAFAVTTLLATLFSGENISYAPTTTVTENWSTIRIASYALFVVITLMWTAILLLANKGNKTGNKINLAWLLTLGSGGVILFPFLLGNSHDYRLIFLLPLAAGAILLTIRNPILGSVLALTATTAAITSAAMVPTPTGFIWPKPALVVGDAALMILLAGITALWLTTAFKKVGQK